jgi:hypothetical protein
MLVEPGWAPLSVVGLYLVLAEFGLTERFDHWLHFLGGAATGYFLVRVIEMFAVLGASQAWVRYVVAFTSGCTVAVLWEVGEFASDVWLHTAGSRVCGRQYWIWCLAWRERGCRWSSSRACERFGAEHAEAEA